MKVSFRAEFIGLKPGPLNPGHYKFSLSGTPATIEIFDYNGKWYAGPAPASKKTAYPLPPQPHHGSAKDVVADQFERQVSPWRMFDPLNGQYIDPDDVTENLEGKFTRKQFTHIARADQVGMGGNDFKTECDIVVGAHQLIAKRGDTPPRCATCRVAWEARRKAEKTL